MKVIILDNENVEEILEHFVAYGYDDFIVCKGNDDERYSRLKKYYFLNDITVTFIKVFEHEETANILNKIKGSLQNRFFIVYSRRICNADLDILLEHHKAHQGVATIYEVGANTKYISSVIFEEEVFDYLKPKMSLEREVLKRIGQENELSVYSQ